MIVDMTNTTEYQGKIYERLSKGVFRKYVEFGNTDKFEIIKNNALAKKLESAFRGKNEVL